MSNTLQRLTHALLDAARKAEILPHIERLRDEGLKVSALQMRFIQPMPSGIREILARFKHVMTIEGNWSEVSPKAGEARSADGAER